MAEVAGVELDRQIGPLPLGVWIAAVAGGLGLAWYANRRGGLGGGSTSSSGDSGGYPTGVGLGGVVGLAQGAGGGATDGGQTGPAAQPTPLSNQQWANQAESSLLAQGYDAQLVDTAIRSYLGGVQLTAGQQGVIDLALRQFGPPPYPVPLAPPTLPPGGTTPPGTTPPPPAPPAPPVTPAMFGLPVGTTRLLQVNPPDSPSGIWYWDGSLLHGASPGGAQSLANQGVPVVNVTGNYIAQIAATTLYSTVVI